MTTISPPLAPKAGISAAAPAGTVQGVSGAAITSLTGQQKLDALTQATQATKGSGVSAVAALFPSIFGAAPPTSGLLSYAPVNGPAPDVNHLIFLQGWQNAGGLNGIR